VKRAAGRRLKIPADDVERLAEAVGVLMGALPGGRVEMATVLVRGVLHDEGDLLGGGRSRAAEAAVPDLEILELGDTEVELSELRALPKLRHLILDRVPEPDLSLLASLPQLKKLELVHMPWADLSPFQARPDIEIVRR
jgi:hypothetical protein